MKLSTFNNLNLSAEIMSAINKLGFEEATPIQEKTIPPALAGHDVIGQAPTGTGKTISFAIPIVERISAEANKPQALVITPTRELAIQVGEEINKVAQFKGVHALPIYGGQDINRQIRALKKNPQIIVGTPGRIMDHLRRSTIRFHNLKIVVLDEADEMLNMGFLEDIETILQAAPSQRQTMLFSATMPKQIVALANKFMNNPAMVKIAPKAMTVDNTEQYYIEIPHGKKFDTLCNLLDMHAPTSAIVFGRTKRGVDEVTEALTKRGYSAEGLHGDLTQARRDSVMRQFRSGATEILVATDVAARGLDIDSVTHVYNFDIPQDPESYVHRIGRTGRAGRTGLAITLITPRELSQLKFIERLTKKKIQRLSAPTLTEAREGAQQVAIERLIATIEEQTANSYRGLAESLLEHHDSVTLLAAAIKLLTKEPNTTPVNITEERPKPQTRKNQTKHPRSNSLKKRKRRK